MFLEPSYKDEGRGKIHSIAATCQQLYHAPANYAKSKMTKKPTNVPRFKLLGRGTTGFYRGFFSTAFCWLCHVSLFDWRISISHLISLSNQSCARHMSLLDWQISNPNLISFDNQNCLLSPAFSLLLYLCLNLLFLHFSLPQSSHLFLLFFLFLPSCRRLLAIPTSCRQVAAYNSNWVWVFIATHSPSGIPFFLFLFLFLSL